MSSTKHRPFSVPLTDSLKGRLEALARAMTEQATAAGLPAASTAFVARQAIELGVDALERKHAPAQAKARK